ncbi:MAG: VanZ family protein [Bacteroidota bacterium]
MRYFFRYWFPLLFWLTLIFSLSHQDGDTSSSLSNWVVSILEFLRIDPDTLRQPVVKTLVRKAAHMTEYFILFLLFFRLISTIKPFKTSLVTAFLFTVAYAATDEFHQIFIPGRLGTIFDVGIDSLGALIALLLCVYYQRRKANNSQKKTSFV